MFKKIVINTFSNYVFKGVLVLLNLIAIPLLISEVGQEGFGIIIFASTLCNYFNILDFGLADGVIKFVSQFNGQRNYKSLSATINTSLCIFSFIGIIVCGSVFILVKLNILQNFNISNINLLAAKNTFYIAGLITLFAWPQFVINAAFKGLQNFSTLNLLLGSGRITSTSIALIYTYFYDPSIPVVFFLFNSDKIYITLISYFALRKNLPSWRFRINDFSVKIIKTIFSFSAWLMLMQIAILLEYQVDQLIISTMVSVSGIAIYTVIFYIFHLIQQVSGLAATTLMPAISQYREEQNNLDFKLIILRCVKYHNMIFAPFTVSCYLVCESLILIWVGQDYIQYIWLIKLSIIFQLLWQSGAAFGQAYLGLGLSKKPGIVAITLGISNVLCSLFLVKIYGLIGVVLGTLICGSMGVPIAVYWQLPDLKINNYEYWVKTVLDIQFIPLLLLISASYISPNILQINSWVTILLLFMFFNIFQYYLIYTFKLDKKEKESLKLNLYSLVYN